MKEVAVLPGDGIGPEVTAVAVRVLQAAGLKANFTNHPVGWSEWCRRGEALPATTLEACRTADAILFGAITSKPDDQAQAELAPGLQAKYRSPILRLRQELGLYANIRPVRAPGIDLVLFRENTEGLYCGYEAHPISPALAREFPGLPEGDEAAVTLRLVTKPGARRICEAAFLHARTHGRRRVTLVDKANVLRATGGLMRQEFFAVARQFPGILADEMHVDAAAAHLVRHAGTFDVIVATNLFGDILSDVAAEAGGGLPLAASANIGNGAALFEPVHGSAPDIAGQGIANPLGAVRSAAMLARHLGQDSAAQRIEAAIQEVLDKDIKPQDMGGTATTSEIEFALTDAVTPKT